MTANLEQRARELLAAECSGVLAKPLLNDPGLDLNRSQIPVAFAIRAITTALKGQPASSGWEPIETAPKDGSEILCFGLYYGKPTRFVAIWNGIEWYAGWGNAIRPIVWQPLPVLLNPPHRSWGDE